MALSFLDLPDKHGVCIIILTGHNNYDKKRAAVIHDYVAKKTHNQILSIDSDSDSGRKLVSFYSLPKGAMPMVLLIRDNDQLAHHWYNDQLRDLGEITYQANLI